MFSSMRARTFFVEGIEDFANSRNARDTFPRAERDEGHRRKLRGFARGVSTAGESADRIKKTPLPQPLGHARHVIEEWGWLYLRIIFAR